MIRKIQRNVARKNMEKSGRRHLNKPTYLKDRNGMIVKDKSIFASEWRRYL